MRFLLIVILMLTGCATPAQHYANEAIKLGLTEATVTTPTFQHRLYLNALAQTPSLPARDLHVYLDGDGTPWEQERWPADDPTARNPMLLRLMAMDNSPAILLGRPCYHGLSHSLGCEGRLWTSKRYARDIVDSMAAALKSWLQTHPFNHLVLIGHSGGGTLATLMVEQIAEVQTVVTLAANLDVAAWCRFHDAEPLLDSLNPMTEKPLASHIKQFHLAGARDEVVPARIIESYAKRQPDAVYMRFLEFDHHCCWETIWQNSLHLF
ncbi:MAG: alpha/beta hydrolase [Methylovulum sp.]|nr:alpha/beta hydrolase [Methylovulum sp.]